MAKVKAMSSAELSLFFSNMEMVYHSGLPLSEGFDILRGHAADAAEHERLDLIYKNTSEGLALHESLEKVGGFPDYALSLITIGEQTGRMEETFRSLRMYYEHRDELAQSIRSSLVYPVSMMVMVFLVVVLLLTQAMPVFEQVFAQLGFTMTGISAALLSVGRVLSDSALYIALALVLVIAVLLVIRATPFGRRFFSVLFQSSPFTRELSLRMSTQRFALALSTLLHSGLSVDEALDLAQPLVEDRRAAARVQKVRDQLHSGEGFPTAIENSKLFPPASMALLSVAFKTGTDAEALEQIGEQITVSTESRLENLIAAIEPTLVGIMCVLVGVILLSVMLPLLGALTGL